MHSARKIFVPFVPRAIKAGHNSLEFNGFEALRCGVSDLRMAVCVPYSCAMTDGEEKNWRVLCELVARETNPQKLRELVEQLTKALDARAEKLEKRRDETKEPSPQ